MVVRQKGSVHITGLVPGPADETDWVNLDLFRERTKELTPVITGYLYSLEDRAKVFQHMISSKVQ